MQKKITTLCLGVLTLVLFTACKCDKNNNHAATTGADAAAAAGIAGSLDLKTGNFIYETGEISSIKLPNGMEISGIGKNSTEAKLFNFLNNADSKISEDKTQGWITLDRVYFKTGGSELTEESSKQVKNISEILKAFPKTKIKIGGYTDNTGSDEANQRVSENRAKTVADELVKLGIAADKVPAEGYGPQHPVCPANDTDVCKAQNRRVDIRISDK